MSRNVLGYTEARIKGKWYCIDFFQFDAAGHIHHIPCLEGQSMVYTALQWDCDLEPIRVPTDLSDQVRESCTGRNGRIPGEDDPHWNPWHMIRGSWFGTVDLEQPEYCGFFSRQDVTYHLSNPSENEINENNMLPVEMYHNLPDEEKKA